MPTPSSPFLPDEHLAAGATRLDALARAQELVSGPIRVLFVCSHNAGRSRMAAALLADACPEPLTEESSRLPTS
ncbi:hypothetical protein OG523_05755 [Streptomyces virginiae]|uniref:hypothetical protein n=1 Tax=Streptomyces virginiae TaxID=1961 RepID=UPI00224E6E8C|nr:hypothetical protein [Streptomyces virginiae]MCX5175275.1 hypothetical protein [Streptomyces virginiae]